MKGFTQDALKKSKVGQLPANKKLLDEALGSNGQRTSVFNLDPVASPQPQCNAPGIPLVGQLAPYKGRKDGFPIVAITLIRFGAREFDEDNYIAGCKPVRDAVARALGVDDADKRIKWYYHQIAGAGRFGILVKIDAFV